MRSSPNPAATPMGGGDGGSLGARRCWRAWPPATVTNHLGERLHREVGGMRSSPNPAATPMGGGDGGSEQSAVPAVPTGPEVRAGPAGAASSEQSAVPAVPAGCVEPAGPSGSAVGEQSAVPAVPTGPEVRAGPAGAASSEQSAVPAVPGGTSRACSARMPGSTTGRAAAQAAAYHEQFVHRLSAAADIVCGYRGDPAARRARVRRACPGVLQAGRRRRQRRITSSLCTDRGWIVDPETRMENSRRGRLAKSGCRGEQRRLGRGSQPGELWRLPRASTVAGSSTPKPGWRTPAGDGWRNLGAGESNVGLGGFLIGVLGRWGLLGGWQGVGWAAGGVGRWLADAVW